MLESLLNTIRQTYPELTIEDAFLNEEGQYNYVVVVNNSTVFRFARWAESIRTLRKEVAILGSIQSYVTLDIPNPIYQRLEGERPEQCFIGYPMIQGIPLWQNEFGRITNETTLNRMAAQIATFLKELHGIPAHEIVPIQLVDGDNRVYWTDLYNRFRSKLFPHMSTIGQNNVVSHFINFLDNPERFAYESSLRHGDFGGGNLIFDNERRKMAGVIDFGFAELGDPAIDIAGLFGFGESFVERCVSTYPEIENMLERVNFYRGTFALQEALYGIEHNDTEAFESGIANYR